jgi:predicted TPR repeat methyltransferase
MDAVFDQARKLFLEGVAHVEAQRLPEAERSFAASLALVPGRPSTLTNLGAVRLKLGRPQDALPVLEEALAQEPGNLEALGHCAIASAELGHREQALALFDRALAVDARGPLLWMLRGSVLQELGRHDKAAASFEESIARGGDAVLNGWYLAGLGRAPVPRGAPPAYVEGLFDGYAEGFEEHVRTALAYDAPRVLTRRWAASGGRWRSALDLGCGTGLAGPHLRTLAARVTGVDLSGNMLARARERGCYDALHKADVAAFLAGTGETFDLVIAADVFIYVGALDDVFGSLARVMPAGGAFAFTVEESAGPELELRASLRYAHSEASIRRLARDHGFEVEALERGAVREDQRVPIPGLFAWLRKS